MQGYDRFSPNNTTHGDFPFCLQGHNAVDRVRVVAGDAALYLRRAGQDGRRRRRGPTQGLLGGAAAAQPAGLRDRRAAWIPYHQTRPQHQLPRHSQ